MGRAPDVLLTRSTRVKSLKINLSGGVTGTSVGSGAALTAPGVRLDSLRPSLRVEPSRERDGRLSSLGIEDCDKRSLDGPGVGGLKSRKEARLPRCLKGCESHV